SECFLHVFGLFYFIVTPFVTETQNRYTKFVDCVRVYFTIVVFPGNGFSTSGHTNRCAIIVTIIILQRRAIATSFFLLPGSVRIFSIDSFNTKTKAISRHCQASAVLNMISSREIKFFVIEPPRCVYVHATNTIFVVTFPSNK